MLASAHQLNADLEKGALRRALLKRLRPSRLAAAARQCTSQADVNALCDGLRRAAAAAADRPILDLPRLRAGAQGMLAGAGMLALAAAGAAWQILSPLAGVAGMALSAATSGCAIGGIWLVNTGRKLRREKNLPQSVSGADVESAARWVRELCEDSRAPASTASLQNVSALMTLDAATLLFIAAPALLPESRPIEHLGLVVIGAVLVATLSLKAIYEMARSVRSVQVRALHAIKSRGDAHDRQQAAAIRLAFDGALNARWPSRVSWISYAGALPWALALAGLQGLLLWVRLAQGDAADIAAPMTIAATLAALTTVFGVRSAISAECLAPEVVAAKRLLARYGSPAQLEAVLEADRAELNERLAVARTSLTAALEPRIHGAPTFEVPELALPARPAQLLRAPARLASDDRVQPAALSAVAVAG